MRVAQPSPDAILEAARLIQAGQLVAFPTETVYGLGADASNGRAVAAIYEAKGRPRFNPLIATVASAEAARRIGQFGPSAQRLAEAFWPGPLTLVVPLANDAAIASLATAGLDTVAIRVPSHPVARALLLAVDRPVAAPSANRSGHVSATTAQHVADDLGEAVAMILDGGPTAHGIESTIVDASGAAPMLLRPGAVTSDAIAAVLGHPLLRQTGSGGDRPTAPGQLESHYAPGLPVRLAAAAPREGEAFLAFGPGVPAYDGPLLNLSPRGDLAEAAANLFEALRRLDRSGASAIAVAAIPERGLGEAINDRLRRAAAPRSSEAVAATAGRRAAS